MILNLPLGKYVSTGFIVYVVVLTLVTEDVYIDDVGVDVDDKNWNYTLSTVKLLVNVYVFIPELVTIVEFAV